MCLVRLERGDLTGGVPWKAYTEHQNFKHKGWFTLLCVLWGEPPCIERSLQGQVHKPSAADAVAFKQWHEERERQAPIQEEPEKITSARDFTKRPTWAEGEKE